MVSTVLEHYIMGVPPHLMNYFRYMSVTSFFDFDLLQQVLIEYFPTVHRSTNSIMKIMGDMTSTSFNLAKWETGRTGVVISPVIRKALSLDCRLNYTPLYKQ